MLASMRRGWFALAFVACAGALGASRPVAAGPRRPERKPPGNPASRIALVQLRIAGDAPAEIGMQLEQSIARGLAALKLEVVPTEQVRTALEGTPLFDCVSVTCLQEMATRLNASRFLRGNLDASGSNFGIQLELTDTAGNLSRKTGQCDVCTLSELNDTVARLAGELITAPDAPPIQVQIVSRPEGASLEIDGKPAGPAPFAGQLTPGHHEVRALLAGRRETTRTIEVRSGEPRQQFEIILDEPARPPPPRAARGRPYRTWKWVAAGGAGLAVVGGLILISVDGDQTCSLTPPQQECPERLDTLPGGLLTVGLGIAAGATSAWMFLHDRRDRAAASADPLTDRSGRVQPRLSFSRGGAIAGVRWRF
jgi:PEGA domain-containing protein